MDKNLRARTRCRRGGKNVAQDEATRGSCAARFAQYARVSRFTRPVVSVDDCQPGRRKQNRLVRGDGIDAAQVAQRQEGDRFCSLAADREHVASKGLRDVRRCAFNPGVRFCQRKNCVYLVVPYASIDDQAAGGIGKPRLLCLNPVGDACENHGPALSHYLLRRV
ncbi:hypothetical protein [Burkholderia gladioli]|uniref:hypothetical protein n=1 Tax=Burkholderia gladioli TaxID=28095 RepID=UPI0018C8B0D5|nr:hypothetical protein [Burkholderia gladioli]